MCHMEALMILRFKLNGRTRQGFAEWEVDVHWACFNSTACDERMVRQGRPRITTGKLCDTRVVEPTNTATKNVRLRDCLRRPHITQLRRSICRQHQNGHMREDGLNDRSVKMRHCGSRGAQQDGWSFICQTDT